MGSRMAGLRSKLMRVGSVSAVVLGATGLTLMGATAAGAAGSTSPPAGSVPTSCSVNSSLTVTGTTPVTETLTVPSTCTFAANSSVTVAYQGNTLETVTADGGGNISVVLSATDPHFSVDGGAQQTASVGSNSIVASGTNASGATNTATFLVDLEQPGGATGSGSGGGLAFTGADLAALVGAALALILLGTGIVLYTRRRADRLRSA